MECVFLNKLQNLVRDTLLERIEAPPPDLSPSPGIGHLLNILRQVLSVAAVTEDKQEDTSMVREIIDTVQDFSSNFNIQF